MLRILTLLLLLALLPACTRSHSSSAQTIPAPQQIVPSAAAAFNFPPTRSPQTPIQTPTPDTPRFTIKSRTEVEQYRIQFGDSLGGIAQRYGVTVDALMRENGLTNPDVISVDQILTIPVPAPGATGSAFKIIPDSELVYGPYSLTLNMDEFVQKRGGYLKDYTEFVDGKNLTGAQIVLRVSQYYSVNPRLLLALLDHQSGWVSNSAPDELAYPLGYYNANNIGLYRQLTWTANELNRGYYLWKAGGLKHLALADGTIVPLDPTINAGTAGVQNFFAKLNDRASWDQDVSLQGLFSSYFFLFEYPFDYTIEPLVPPTLQQPPLTLPFAVGETWSFTGGPHGGWDTGSAWAAIDFAPPGEAAGCTPSEAWIVAMADGLIVRSEGGAVVQDLDGDGYEQTGWTLLYMHIASDGRVAAGTYLKSGERIGHPSCEGGFSSGTHVHIARRYNGEWISADGSLPFVVDGWVSSGAGREYDGYLTRNNQTIEAWDGRNALNQITR